MSFDHHQTFVKHTIVLLIQHCSRKNFGSRTLSNSVRRAHRHKQLFPCSSIGYNERDVASVVSNDANAFALVVWGQRRGTGVEVFLATTFVDAGFVAPAFAIADGWFNEFISVV